METRTLQIGVYAMEYRLFERVHKKYNMHSMLYREEWNASEQSIRALIQERTEHWYLRDGLHEQTLHERTMIRLHGRRWVEICRFGEPTTKEQYRLMQRALARIHLLTRVGNWSLKRICLRADTPTDPLSGLPRRAMSHSGSEQFALFPSVMDIEKEPTEEVKNRLPEDCTELEGTMLHEWARACIEPLVQREWLIQMDWIETARYPEWQVTDECGHTPMYVCIKPDECPNTRAQQSPSEDIAESIVLYAYHPEKLMGERQNVLASHLEAPSKNIRRYGTIQPMQQRPPRTYPTNILKLDRAMPQPLPTRPMQQANTRISIKNFRKGVQNGSIPRR